METLETMYKMIGTLLILSFAFLMATIAWPTAWRSWRYATRAFGWGMALCVIGSLAILLVLIWFTDDLMV